MCFGFLDLTKLAGSGISGANKDVLRCGGFSSKSESILDHVWKLVNFCTKQNTLTKW